METINELENTLRQLDKTYGTVLEVGAGTGYLTLGMLADSEFDHAVISDISPEMWKLPGRAWRAAHQKS